MAPQDARDYKFTGDLQISVVYMPTNFGKDQIYSSQPLKEDGSW